MPLLSPTDRGCRVVRRPLRALPSRQSLLFSAADLQEGAWPCLMFASINTFTASPQP